MLLPEGRDGTVLFDGEKGGMMFLFVRRRGRVFAGEGGYDSMFRTCYILCNVYIILNIIKYIKTKFAFNPRTYNTYIIVLDFLT